MNSDNLNNTLNNMPVKDIIDWCNTHSDPERKKQYEEELARYNALKKEADNDKC